MKIHISQIDRITLLSETEPVAANVTIISDPKPVGGYTHIVGFIFSDVASALNGVIIEQAMSLADFPPGVPATTNVTRSIFTLAANDTITNTYSVQIVAPFVRIIYINGALPQTSFRAFLEARVLRG